MSRIFQFQLKEETVFVIVSQVLTCVLPTRRRRLLQILWKSMSKLENTGDGWMISLKVTWLHDCMHSYLTETRMETVLSLPSLLTILTIILRLQCVLSTLCTSSLANPKMMLITRPCTANTVYTGCPIKRGFLFKWPYQKWKNWECFGNAAW